MKRTTRLLASASALCVAVAGCGSAEKGGAARGSARYATDATFTMALSLDLSSLNPYTSQLAISINPLAYDSMVNLRPDGSLTSGLAEKWTADPRSVTFTLRPGVTCSDGTKLTASHVAAVMTYVGKDPNNAPAQFGLSVPSVPYTATGDDAARTVKVAVDKPFGLLLNMIGLLPIVCPKGLKDPKSLNSASDGTGPYVVASAVAGQSTAYTARKGYAWGPGGATTAAPGLPAKIVVRSVSSKATQANLLSTGALNFGQVNEDDMSRLAARGLKNIEYPVAGTWLTFNQRDNRPGADLRVRQALAMALNSSDALKVSGAGHGIAPTGLISQLPKPCPGNNLAGQAPRYDVAAAAALLDQAGWIKGPNGIRSKNGKPLAVKMIYSPDYAPLDQPTAEFLAQKWKAIGVQANLSPITAAAFQVVVFKTGDWDLYSGGLNVGLPSQLMTFLAGPLPPGGVNYAGIRNAQYKALADKALTMTLPQACPTWNQAEQAVVRNVDFLPIADRAQHIFLDKSEARLGRYAGPIPTSIRVLK